MMKFNSVFLLAFSLMFSCTSDNPYDKVEGVYQFTSQAGDAKKILLNGNLSEEQLDSVMINTEIDETFKRLEFKVILKDSIISYQNNTTDVFDEMTFHFRGDNLIEYKNGKGELVQAALSDSSVSIMTPNPKNRSLLFIKEKIK